MKRRHLYKLLALGLFGVGIAASLGIAWAHGSMSDPVSRVYDCYLQGPESPDTVACSDVIESSGTQPLYDWNEINIGNAGGNHQAIIPDGQLCSAGREKYAAFDEPRTDWARTVMPDGGPYTFLYSAYVPHNQGYFEFWVTKDGYDPTQPLAWDDIEMFALVEEPPVIGGNYVMTVDLPEGKSGHHVIYNIWQRNDSQEAFYACSDVWFGDAPTPTPTTAPPCTAAAWSSATTYSQGDVVSYNNAEWRANWGSSGTAPSGSANPWRIRAYCSSDGSVTPIPPTATTVPPTATAVPPTDVPPTDVPPTGVPPTATSVPPTNVPPTATSAPSGACEVDYVVANSWGNVFQANVTITNNDSTAVSGWTLNFTHAPGQTATGGWNATISQSGNAVTVSNPASYWNGQIAANGGSVSFGLQGTFTGSVVAPDDFVLNGEACNGDTPPATATAVPPTATSVPPTATSVPPTATSIPPTATLIPEITPTATSVPPTATAVPPTSTPGTGGGCSVDYVVQNQWGSGFIGNMTIGVDTAVSGWTLEFDFPGNQTISNMWGGLYSQSGSSVTVTNENWSGNIGANGTTSVGFQAGYSGSNSAPTEFILNGMACD